MKFALKIRPVAMTFLGWAVFVFLLVQVLAQFKVFNLSGYMSPILIPLFGGFFILLDQGIIGMKRAIKKPASILGWILTVLAILVLLGVLLGLIGIVVTGVIATLFTWALTLLPLAFLISLVTE